MKRFCLHFRYVLLDRRHTNSVTWEAFYILLSLYTAYYSKRLTKFLFKHGLMVYQFLLDPVTKRLTFERFARLGFLVGLSEDDILETCLVFGFKKMTIEMVGQEVRRHRNLDTSSLLSDF